jgi:hypothetical protein
MKPESVYNNLKAIDVRPKAEKKGRADYLSWAHAWDMLKSNYPQAQRKTNYEALNIASLFY